MILKFKRMTDYCVHCEASRSVAQPDRSCVLRSRLVGTTLPHAWAHEIQRAQIEAARADPLHIPATDFAPFISAEARDADRARTRATESVEPDPKAGEWGFSATVPLLPVDVVEGSRAAAAARDDEPKRFDIIDALMLGASSTRK